MQNFSDILKKCLNGVGLLFFFLWFSFVSSPFLRMNGVPNRSWPWPGFQALVEGVLRRKYLHGPRLAKDVFECYLWFYLFICEAVETGCNVLLCIYLFIMISNQIWISYFFDDTRIFIIICSSRGHGRCSPKRNLYRLVLVVKKIYFRAKHELLQLSPVINTVFLNKHHLEKKKKTTTTFI